MQITTLVLLVLVQNYVVWVDGGGLLLSPYKKRKGKGVKERTRRWRKKRKGKGGMRIKRRK